VPVSERLFPHLARAASVSRRPPVTRESRIPETINIVIHTLLGKRGGFWRLESELHPFARKHLSFAA
jgi:hypothetical protein